MAALSYAWRACGAERELRLVEVPGTDGKPYFFGAPPNSRPIEVHGFYIATTPTTQALWVRVMRANSAVRADPRSPIDNVSWDDINGAGGFLDRINSSEILAAFAGRERNLRFRLPSETEWEYAARGGPHWTDGFAFSGSDDPRAVAWYGLRWSRPRIFGWRRFSRRRFGNLFPTRTHQVGTKAPNQLGIYDMSGNVWEWCRDACTDEIDAVPADGTPWLGPSPERRLRGGCHHNWEIHCSVWWRYGIIKEAHDGCIGFRLVLAAS